jgi:O-antigen/teichoic acid export membrane protein
MEKGPSWYNNAIMGLSENNIPRRKTLWFTSLYTLFASLVVVAANFVTDVLVVRTLGPEGKGSYALIVTTGLVLMVVLGQSLSTGVAYVVSRSRPSMGSLALQLLGVGVLQFFLAFGLLWTIQQTAISNAFLPPKSDLTILLLAALLPVLQNLGEYWRMILISQHEAVKANQLVMVQRLLQVGLLIILAGLYFWGGVKFGYVLVVGLVVFSFAIMNSLFIKHLAGEFTWGSSGIKSIFMFSVPVYMGDVFKALNYRMDVFFVSYFQNARELGFYTTAVGTANLILMVASAFATNLLPRVASTQGSIEDNARRTAQIVRIIFWFNLVCAIGLGGISYWLLPFLYTPVFINSVPALLLILPGTWLLSLMFILASYINGIGKPRVNLYISMIALVVTVILDMTLIPRYSIEGASVASSMAYSLATLLSMAYFLRQTGLPATSLFVLNRDDINQLWLVVERLKARWQGGASKPEND